MAAVRPKHVAYWWCYLSVKYIYFFIVVFWLSFISFYINIAHNGDAPTWNYTFFCCFVRVWKLSRHVIGGRNTQDFRKRVPEEPCGPNREKQTDGNFCVIRSFVISNFAKYRAFLHATSPQRSARRSARVVSYAASRGILTVDGGS
jgi:hypothetical protein